MAEAFLSQLPSIEKDTLAEDDQQCPICLEDYGNNLFHIDISEHPVKLPCSHIMGSKCIAIWVSSHDTCPFCRHVLFRATFTAPPIIRFQTDYTDEDQPELQRVFRVLQRQCTRMSAELGLFYSRTASLATQISQEFQRGYNREPLETLAENNDRGTRLYAAASVYIASHLVGSPRSMRTIAVCFNDFDIQLGSERIRGAYHALYLFRYSLLGGQSLTRARIDELLPVPSN